MYAKFVATLVLVVTLVGAAPAETAPDWIQEFMLARAPQTKVVRHPVDRGKFYLCWQEGQQRFGLAFRRSNFDDKLRQIKPGGSASLAAMLPIDQGAWTAADEKMCWG